MSNEREDEMDTEKYYQAEMIVRDQMSCEGVEFGDEMSDSIAEEMHNRTMSLLLGA